RAPRRRRAAGDAPHGRGGLLAPEPRGPPPRRLDPRLRGRGATLPRRLAARRRIARTATGDREPRPRAPSALASADPRRAASELAGQLVEVGQRREGDAAALEPASEATGGEHAPGRERGAVVGVPVAGEDPLAGRQVRALARLAADLAGLGHAKAHAPAVRPRVDAVGPQLDGVEHALALEHRLDQLVKTPPDHERVPP